METSEVKSLLESELADCEIEVKSDGSHFEVTVIGEIFAGMSPLNKQRTVNKVLMDHITSGAIHAVNIKTFTPDEWAKSQKLSIASS